MAKLRDKNTSREIRDIRFPTSHVPEKSGASETPIRKVRPVPLPRHRAPITEHRRFLLWPIAIFACLVLLTAIVGGFLWYRNKAAQVDHIQAALVQAKLPVPTPDLPSSIGGWISVIKDIFSNYGGIEKSSLQAVGTLSNVASLIKDIPDKFLAKDGPGVVADLATLSDGLGSLGDFLDNIAAGGANTSALSGLSEYLAYAPDVERARVVVERLSALLQSPGEHHLLILFGNSAELRPGGGFLGSLADLTFGSSTIGDVVVRDINEVDRGLAANIVPPKPMQGIVTRWRAADANWFFDYPESASKTLELMSRSSFYTSSTLDGAILISPKVIQDLLAATGPILLDDGKTTVAVDTVIPMIQREVQEGQANGVENPKEILSKLLQPMEDKLKSLDAAATDKLMGLAQDWLRNKDMAVFMKDPELMKVFSYYRADGGAYAIPQSFSGDYFAAVNANLGGGKSDAFITDTIDFESDLRADGVIENRVTVVKESSAKGSDEWWYRVTNQDYLQVFTPIGVTLTAAGGGKARVIAPRANYSRGFETDPDVVAMESTLKPAPGFPSVSQFRQSGKNVFATWLTTPAGSSATVRFQYRRVLKAPFHDGEGYTFVFERQSGARQSFHLILNAPPGFVWQDGGLSKYEYFNESVAGRTVLNLTLKAI
jgi:hypothetical protein